VITEEPSATKVPQSTAETTEEKNGEVTAETPETETPETETPETETPETPEPADLATSETAAPAETVGTAVPTESAIAVAASEGDAEMTPTDDLSSALDVGANGGTAAGSRPGQLPAWWTDAYPQVTDVSTATAYLDGLGGAMSRKQENGRWVLSTGEQVLFEADTAQELDGFILGFALSQLIAERHGPIAHARRN
jgi:hypothetical protein